jgi:ribosomal protein S18 acetylase RimI-like enzyme
MKLSHIYHLRELFCLTNMTFNVQICNSESVLNQIIDLRFRILRQPWNKPIETVTDELEHSSVNAYIEFENKVIACARLQNNGNGVGQIRYMAVDDAFQGNGFGKKLIQKLEEEAMKMKLHKLELQARENALNFYKNSGYQIVNSSFKLWDIIQHYLMFKIL